MKQFLMEYLEEKRRDLELACENQVLPLALGNHIEEAPNYAYLGSGNPAHRVDFYRPTIQSTPLPVVVVLHGGGLVLGSKLQNRHFCATLCKKGYVVCAVDYRLAPEYTVFDQLQDISDALGYIRKVAPDFGGDPDRVFLVGEGAGAYLTVLTSAILKNPKASKAASVNTCHVPIERIALIGGMLYPLDSFGLLLSKPLFGSGFRQHPFWDYRSPNHPQINLFQPPTFLVTSSSDPLRRCTTRYARVLERNHCTYMLRHYSCNRTQINSFPIRTPALAQSRQVIDEVSGFFQGKFDILMDPYF